MFSLTLISANIFVKNDTTYLFRSKLIEKLCRNKLMIWKKDNVSVKHCEFEYIQINVVYQENIIWFTVAICLCHSIPRWLWWHFLGRSSCRNIYRMPACSDYSQWTMASLPYRFSIASPHTSGENYLTLKQLETQKCALNTATTGALVLKCNIRCEQ